METTARAKTIRMSDRKVRLVADMIRNQRALAAVTLLQFTRRDAAQPLLTLVKSAIANAEHNYSVSAEQLWITRIQVDNAGFIKRFRPRAMGRAGEIHKHLCHVVLTLSDVSPKKDKPAKPAAKLAKTK